MKKSHDICLTQEDAIDILQNIPSEVLKEIVRFEQPFGIDQFQAMVSSKRDVFQSYLQYFPEFQTVFNIINEIKAYYETAEGQQAFLNKLSYGRNTSHLVPGLISE